ncbi:PaaI family thioesterase [Sphingomonas sp.]|uniref:PaaI family thioesterase n=1 Tax=Sphingomonas sp. TaxID=28214 RepID=UPI0035BBA425
MGFDVERFSRHRFGGHGGRLGLGYHAHGPDWVEMVLPWSADLIGDVEGQVLASGPIIALMDVATSIAVWAKRDAFVPHATLDLRVDYLRPARTGQAVIGRGECYRITRAIAFIRGQAHDGDPGDPVAHVAGTYMTLDA